MFGTGTLAIALVLGHVVLRAHPAKLLLQLDIVRVSIETTLRLAACLNEAKDRRKMETLPADRTLEPGLLPLVDRVARIADRRGEFGWRPDALRRRIFSRSVRCWPTAFRHWLDLARFARRLRRSVLRSLRDRFVQF
jgi:hypothetical protein|tara:strand:- start:1148 stop:1558 length:411 start_codon:yes stop_codon:yes gene_type:complete